MKQWQIFAILAALCNASIGSISKILFHTGLHPIQVVFYKCILAFLLISILCINRLRNFFYNRKKDWYKIAICAFFGVFVLYFFETEGYSYANIATIVFILLGASTITTFLVGRIILKESVGSYQLLALFLALFGLAIMVKPTPENSCSIGGILAAIAGIGYGLFFITAKKFKIKTTGLDFLWWFIGFGSLFLLVPFLLNHPTLPKTNSLPGLILLAVIPTFGGYYFTSKALSQGLASGVQIFELSEPIFATFLGFTILGEFVTIQETIGGVLIIFAIYFFNKKHL